MASRSRLRSSFGADREEIPPPKEPTKAAQAALKRELKKLKTSQLRARYERQVRAFLIEAMLDEDAMRRACELEMQKHISQGARKLIGAALGFKNDWADRWELDRHSEGMSMAKELTALAWEYAKKTVVPQAETIFEQLTKEQLAALKSGIKDQLHREIGHYLEAEAEAQVKALKEQLKQYLTEDTVVDEEDEDVPDDDV